MSNRAPGRARYRDCERKRRYRSEDDANQALVRYARQSRDRKATRSYECEHCGGWHLTSMEIRS